MQAVRLILSTDKEYRKGVHWLETLRLRRTRILTSGYKVIYSALQIIHRLLTIQSLETFVYEYSTTVKSVLEKYLDNMMCVHLFHCLRW